MDHIRERVTAISIACLLAMTLVFGSFGSAIATRQTDNICVSKYIPLIQNAGLDVQKSAPTMGCRLDQARQWQMPTVGTLTNDPAYQNLDTWGQDILAAVDRMSMDHAFDLSVRYDRARAVAITLGPYSSVNEKDISDAQLYSAPTWTHNYWDGYQQAMMTYLTRTQGDEDELLYYIDWFVSRRDITISVVLGNLNPMLANAERYNWGYQRAPWPWQLADPYAIAEYTGQGSALPTNTSVPAGNQSGIDALDAWLDVSPRLLRVAPGGSAVYVVQPVFLGDWSTSPATLMRIEVRLPSGVRLDGDPVCAMISATNSDSDECDIKIEENDGTTRIILRSNLKDRHSERLSLPLSFNTDLKPGTALSIQAFFQIIGPSEYGNYGGGGGYQKVRAVVTDSSEVRSGPESNMITGRIELTANYSAMGEVCVRESGASDIVLYEWGGTSVLSRVPVSTGLIGTSSDGTSREACIIDFQFTDVPAASVYQVAVVASGETIPCRACILGTIPQYKDAEPVFVLEW